LRIHFQFFSRFFCFPFSLPFFSLYLLPFIPFLSTGKVLASVLQKTWKWNIDQIGDLAYFTTNFAPKIGYVFSGIALPEFGRYSKWTHCTYGWICPCCISCLSKQFGDVKMMTSQVVQWFPTLTSGKYYSWRERVKTECLWFHWTRENVINSTLFDPNTLIKVLYHLI